MNETSNPESELSIDPDGVIDLPSNSGLAIFGFLLGLVSLFAIVEPFFVFPAVAAFLMGCLALVYAVRQEIAPASRWMAHLAVFLGLFAIAAGAVQFWIEKSSRDRFAMEVAEEYLTALANGDQARAIAMTGLPAMVDDDELRQRGEMSREQQAIRAFLADRPIQEVLRRGKEAQWKPIKVLSSSYRGGVTDIRVQVVDVSRLNQQPIIVTVKRIPPNRYSVITRTQWLVSSIEDRQI